MLAHPITPYRHTYWGHHWIFNQDFSVWCHPTDITEIWKTYSKRNELGRRCRLPYWLKYIFRQLFLIGISARECCSRARNTDSISCVDAAFIFRIQRSNKKKKFELMMMMKNNSCKCFDSSPTQTTKFDSHPQYSLVRLIERRFARFHSDSTLSLKAISSSSIHASVTRCHSIFSRRGGER